MRSSEVIYNKFGLHKMHDNRYDSYESRMLHLVSIDCGFLFYIVSLTIWLIYMIFQSSMLGAYLSHVNAIRYICLGLALFSLLFNRDITARDIIAVVVFAIFASIPAAVGERMIIDVLLFAYCGRKHSFRKIAKYVCITTSVCLIIVIVCAYTGFIENYIQVINGRVRHFMGFVYALRPAQYSFLITLLVVYLRGDSIKLVELACLAVVNLFIFLMANTRLSFYLSVAVIVSAIALRGNIERFFSIKFIRVAFTYIFIIMSIIALAFTLCYSPTNDIASSINSWLGGRLSMGKIAIDSYGIHLFGQYLPLVGGSIDYTGYFKTQDYTYFYLDSLYIRILSQFGIVFFAGFLGAMTAVMRLLFYKREYWLILVVAFVAVHALIDDLVLFLQYDTFLLLIGYLATNADKCDANEIRMPIPILD